jgi:hypothetical protein
MAEAHRMLLCIRAMPFSSACSATTLNHYTPNGKSNNSSPTILLRPTTNGLIGE